MKRSSPSPRNSSLAAPRPVQPVKCGFPPIARSDARLLILGTLPGEDSLRLQQYYGHKHNAFWRLISAILEADTPADYPTRKVLLVTNRWALWDVLARAERTGSSDAAIRHPSANAFDDFFAEHRDIRAIAFNGQKARALFVRHVLKRGLEFDRNVHLIDLPSSSPLHTVSFKQKLAAWRAALEGFAPGAAVRRPKAAH